MECTVFVIRYSHLISRVLNFATFVIWEKKCEKKVKFNTREI